MQILLKNEYLYFINGYGLNHIFKKYFLGIKKDILFYYVKSVWSVFNKVKICFINFIIFMFMTHSLLTSCNGFILQIFKYNNNLYSNFVTVNYYFKWEVARLQYRITCFNLVLVDDRKPRKYIYILNK